MKELKLCKGHGCSAAEECAWYQPKPTFLYENYFKRTPGTDETCEHFLPCATKDD